MRFENSPFEDFRSFNLNWTSESHKTQNEKEVQELTLKSGTVVSTSLHFYFIILNINVGQFGLSL